MGLIECQCSDSTTDGQLLTKIRAQRLAGAQSNTSTTVESALGLSEGTEIDLHSITNAIFSGKQLQFALMRNDIHLARRSGRRDEAFEVVWTGDTRGIANHCRWAR